MSADRIDQLKRKLERIYRGFDFDSHLRHDPLVLAHGYRNAQDREIVAFIAAVFAYGRVGIFKAILERDVFGVMGESPHAFIMRLSARSEMKFRNFRYRFNAGSDLVLLFRTLRSMLEKYGSLENLFAVHHNPSARNVKRGLEGFVGEIVDEAHRRGTVSKGFLYLMPRPSRGSACKRLNLFLRWMVRDADVDLGIWRTIAGSALIIPLDTHVARISTCLGLTRRRSSDWRAAEEITDSLRQMSPADPLKYDFVLSHHGIAGLCRHDRATCAQCEFVECRRS